MQVNYKVVDPHISYIPDHFRLSGVLGISGGKASTSSAMLIRLSCPIFPRALSLERPKVPIEKESFRLGTLVFVACGVSENPTLCVLVGVLKADDGGARECGVVMDGKGACSAKGTAGDDAVVGDLLSFIGDIFNGNGAVNFGADTLCLNGVDTDDADDDADGLP